MKQERLSVSCPAQKSPPLAGAGLLQLRVLSWLPFPHVTLQAPQFDQTDQEPSTESRSMLGQIKQVIIDDQFLWNNEKSFFFGIQGKLIGIASIVYFILIIFCIGLLIEIIICVAAWQKGP